MNRKEFLVTIGAAAATAACAPILCCGQSVPAAQNNVDTAALKRRAEFTDAWVKRLMNVVNEELSPPAREKFMQSNGRACFVSQHGPRAAKPEPDALDRLIAGLKKWCGEDGVRREGNAVYFTYGKPAGAQDYRCLCPVVENLASGLSPSYCQCSVGYVKEMFERAAGKAVSVELVESLKRGGKSCRFLIRL